MRSLVIMVHDRSAYSDVTARLLVFSEICKHRISMRCCAVSAFAREQESSGAWFGRWGTNYIYAHVCLKRYSGQVRYAHTSVRPCREGLNSGKSRCGWGETNDSYLMINGGSVSETSTAVQTLGRYWVNGGR